jgi:hypothetical protein
MSNTSLEHEAYLIRHTVQSTLLHDKCIQHKIQQENPEMHFGYAMEPYSQKPLSLYVAARED